VALADRVFGLARGAICHGRAGRAAAHGSRILQAHPVAM